ncbi:MAG: hypothetical protein C4534_02010 [Gaiellales bacterium]|nr:MAG: hypothetical protein C4534_02010 [Gaiellales bacterium]
MYLNQFSVRVQGGKEQPGGYVELEHGRQYCVVLRNDREVNCDAHVEIDGKPVGTWRVPANQSITLKRPAHDQGRFTFYQVGTPEAAQAGLTAGHPNLGLVKVTFTPALKVVHPIPMTTTVTWGPELAPYFYPYQEGSNDIPLGSAWGDVTCQSVSSGTIPTAYRYQAGGTGLSGQSGQTFVTVAPVDPDLGGQTVIHLRLVGRQEGKVRPLTAYSTPVPPPVG